MFFLGFGILLLGVALMAVARARNPQFFRRTTPVSTYESIDSSTHGS